ncbi:MAG: FtsQ-type POTRA domain-containing protein [Candidatus Margulisiibacteriota bacterium]
MVRKRTRKRKPLVFRLLIALLFLVAVIVAGIYFLSLPIWEIKEVVVNGAKILSDNEMRTLAAIPLSENLFFTRFNRTESNLSKIPAIKSFKIYRIPPATVLINLKERVPIATLIFSKRSVIIDEEGYILNRNPNLSLNIPNLADLPVVTGIDEAEIFKADKIDGKTAQVISDIILKLSQFLESSRLQLELGGLEKASFLLDDLLRVKVGDAEKIKRKMEVFGALLPEIAGRWPQVEYVDVRFPDNPVIKYR